MNPRLVVSVLLSSLAVVHSVPLVPRAECVVYCNAICCNPSTEVCGNWDASTCKAKTDTGGDTGSGNGGRTTWVYRTTTYVDTKIQVFSDPVILPPNTSNPPKSSSVSPYTFTTGGPNNPTRPTSGVVDSSGTKVNPPAQTATDAYTFPIPTDASGNSDFGYGGVIGVDNGDKGGLTGAQIGGIVGGIIGAVALILLILLCCCIRRGYQGVAGLFGGHSDSSHSGSHHGGGGGHGGSGLATGLAAGAATGFLASLLKKKTSTAHHHPEHYAPAPGGLHHSTSGGGHGGHGGGTGLAALAGGLAAGLGSFFLSKKKQHDEKTHYQPAPMAPAYSGHQSSQHHNLNYSQSHGHGHGHHGLAYAALGTAGAAAAYAAHEKPSSGTSYTSYSGDTTTTMTTSTGSRSTSSSTGTSSGTSGSSSSGGSSSTGSSSSSSSSGVRK